LPFQKRYALDTFYEFNCEDDSNIDWIINYNNNSLLQKGSISIKKDEDNDSIKISHESSHYNIPLDKMEYQKIFVTNQNFEGSNPLISLSWLFPDRPFFCFLKLVKPKTNDGDFIFNNGFEEFVGQYNQKLPIDCSEYKLSLMLNRHQPRNLLYLLIYILIIAFMMDCFLLRNKAFIRSKSASLYAFYFFIEALLFIRLVFGIKASLFYPYNQESLTNSIFALIYFPYLIYISMQGKRSWKLNKGKWINNFVKSDQIIYTVIVLGMLLVGIRILKDIRIPFVIVIVTYILINGMYYLIYHVNITKWFSSNKKRNILLFFGIFLILAIISTLGIGEAFRVPMINLRIPTSRLAYIIILPSYIYILYLFRSKKSFDGWFGSFVFLILGFLLASFMISFHAFLSGDHGFFVYLLPLLLVLLASCIKANRFAITAFVFVVLVTAFLISVSLFAPMLYNKYPNNHLAQRIYERTVSLEKMSQDQSSGSGYQESLYRMMFYSTRGLWGEGYLEAPVNYSFHLNDMVYSVFVLAEHGALGGIGILIVYFLIIIFGAHCIGQRFALKPNNNRTNFLFLLSLGSILSFGIVSYYMIAANIQVIFWTGLDMSFLGLDSYGDIIQSSVMIAILICIVSPVYSIKKSNRFSRTVSSVSKSIIVPITIILVISLLIRTNDNNAQDSFKPQVYYNWVNRLIRDEKLIIKHTANDKLVISDEKLDPKDKRVIDRTLLKLDINAFNNGNYNIFDYERESGDKYQLVAINSYKRLIMSPFRKKTNWKGQILSTSSMLNRRIQIEDNFFSLSSKSEYESNERGVEVVIDEFGNPEINKYNTASCANSADEILFMIRHNSDSNTTDWFKIYAYKTDAIIECRCPIWLNGVKLENGEKKKLSNGDIILWRDKNEKNPLTIGALYLKDDGNSLYYIQWVNEGYRIIYPSNESAALVKQLRDVLELNLVRNNRIESDVPVTMTLDILLNQSIIQYLKNRELSRNQDSDYRQLRESVTVLDGINGEVLSVACWPTFNPNNYDILKTLEKNDNSKYKLVKQNLNFTRHVMGSAHKPFLALSALHTRPEIKRLSILHGQNNTFKQLFDFKVKEYKSIPIANSPEVTWSIYLPRSNNLYHAFATTYALLTCYQPGKIPPSIGDYCEPKYRFGAEEWRDRCPPFDLNLLRGKILRNIDKSRLFNYYNSFFRKPLTLDQAIRSLGDIAEKNEEQREIFAKYDAKGWQKLIDRNLLGYWGNNLILYPEQGSLDLDRMSDFRTDWLNFLFGGGSCYWNNVEAAEAFARIITGREITHTFVRTKLDQPNEKPPKIKSMRDDYRNEILKKLNEVVYNGTASSILGKAIRNDAIIRPYMKIFGDRLVFYAKTGTLDRIGRTISNKISEEDESKRQDDSILLLFIGVKKRWSDDLEKGLSVAIYIQEQGMGQATEAAKLIMPQLLYCLAKR
jgi:cell division protein FtsI/penicillin-binding protein 2